MFLDCKKKNGVDYYYLRENQSINGKSICVFQKYIGRKEKLLEALKQGVEHKTEIIKPDKTICLEFGAVAALFTLANKIKLISVIDSIVKKRNQNMLISTYMLVAAINRSIKAKSKRSTAKWLSKTSLPNLIPDIDIQKLTSQSFWDNMNIISETHIAKIEETLTQNVVSAYNLSIDTLLYDTTNYYSYIHTFNRRCHLEKRGKNKQKRYDLRQTNFALMVTENDHIPLYHRVYEGNVNDYSSFSETMLSLKKKKEGIFGKNTRITLVFDMGNVSQKNMKLIEDENIDFISKLKPSNHEELLQIELINYEAIFIQGSDEKKKAGLKIFKTKKILYGKEYEIVIKYNPEQFEIEKTTVYTHIAEVEQKLIELRKRVKKYQTSQKKPIQVTKKSVENSVKSIIKGRLYLSKIIKYDVTLKDDKYPILNYTLEKKDIEEYCKIYLGKTIYFTNKKNIDGAKIVEVYSLQNRIEKVFKISKDRKNGCWWPKFHWTDQKIKVHAFYCYISLLLQSLLAKELASIDIKANMHNIIEELQDIEEVSDFYNNKKKKTFTIKRHTELNKMQKIIFEHLNLSRYINS